MKTVNKNIRVVFGVVFLFSVCQLAAQKKKKEAPVAEINGLADRKFWLAQMDKICRPMLRSLAHDSLRINMPTTVSAHVDNAENRRKVAYLEITGRVLSGIAPFLQGEGGDATEVALRNDYRQWTLQGLKNAMDSSAKDFMRFDLNGQQMVDASFLAVAFLRAPWIWQNLDAVTKERMVASFRTTRQYRPPYSNWLLFAAATEVFLYQNGYDWDPIRVDYAMHKLDEWYVGDGMYTDGPNFAFDYYNSFVIHPYLGLISQTLLDKKNNAYRSFADKFAKRDERYAILQERMINGDGTFPATGRSLIYRGAAFHHLADMALKKKLPAQLSPASVRCALTAVIRKTLENPTTFTKDGWLTIGLYGYQPEMGDVYNNAGSPYLCTLIFLPLGLPATDAFWATPPEQWSAQKIWSGQDFKNDHSEY